MVGVDVDGRKHVLGVWLGDGSEGAKYWLSVLTEICNRGLEDVLIVCCDGLSGLPDAIEATWPQALVQTCVIHLIRGSMRLCSRVGPQNDRRGVADRVHRGERRRRRPGVGANSTTSGETATQG